MAQPSTLIPGQILRATLQEFTKNLRAAIRLSETTAIILTLLSNALHITGRLLSDTPLKVPFTLIAIPMELFLFFFFFVGFQITWYRFLISENRTLVVTRRTFFPWTDVHRTFVIRFLSILGCVVLGMAPVLLLTQSSGTLVPGFLLLIGVIYLVINARLLPCLPSVVSQAPLSLRETWTITEGHTWRLSLVLLTVTLLQFAVLFVVQSLLWPLSAIDAITSSLSFYLVSNVVVSFFAFLIACFHAIALSRILRALRQH